METSKSERPVLVTTSHRGVFVGYTSDAPDAETITLKRARMVVYYSADTRSVLGIASRGPQRGSRVSAPVPSITLRAITAVVDATPEAAEAWERELWG